MLRALTTVFCAAIFLGCAVENGLIPPAPSDDGEAMVGFSWVIDDELAGLPRPGRGGRSVDEDLAFLEEKGIELLFSLTVTAVDSTLAASHAIKVTHLPVRDFTAPTLDQLEKFVEESTAAIRDGKPVGVHCGAGKGRTGTFLSVYFVSKGMTAEEAIAKIRLLRPGSVETDEQERVIGVYYESARLRDKAAFDPSGSSVPKPE